MTSNFLTTATVESPVDSTDLASGTLAVNGSSLTSVSLAASSALKTDANGVIITTNLETSDVNGLDAALSSAGAQAMQSTYDNGSNITTSAADRGVEFQIGSGDDTHTVIEGKNTAGTTTFDVSGEGVITSTGGSLMIKSGSFTPDTTTDPGSLTLRGGPYDTAISIYKESDDAPAIQIAASTHNNCRIGFDCYQDSLNNTASGDLNSNFDIFKFNDEFKIRYYPGAALQSPITMNDGLTMDTSGNITLGGDLTVDGGDVKCSTLDTAGVGTLSIGTTTADSINIGKSTETITLQGPVVVDEGADITGSLMVKSGTFTPVTAEIDGTITMRGGDAILNMYTTEDDYPACQLDSAAHGSIGLRFDCYRTGAGSLKGSTADAFDIVKQPSALEFRVGSQPVGTTYSPSVAMSIPASTGKPDFPLGLTSNTATISDSVDDLLLLQDSGTTVAKFDKRYGLQTKLTTDTYYGAQLYTNSSQSNMLLLGCARVGANRVSHNNCLNVEISQTSSQTLAFRFDDGITPGTNCTMADALSITKEFWLNLSNTTAAPVSNPSGGGYLYCEGGALKYRGSSGTVTTVANA